MQLAQSDSYLCHTGWPNSIPFRAIRVGRIRSYPCHTGRPMHLDQIIPRAIQVGRIQYLSVPYRSANAVGPNHCSVPYRLAKFDTYPCHTGWPDTILSVSYRSANAVGPNHFSVPYRSAGSDTYPCHTSGPMQLALIISPCHTGWPDPILIHAYRSANVVL